MMNKVLCNIRQEAFRPKTYLDVLFKHELPISTLIPNRSKCYYNRYRELGYRKKRASKPQIVCLPNYYNNYDSMSHDGISTKFKEKSIAIPTKWIDMEALTCTTATLVPAMPVEDNGMFSANIGLKLKISRMYIDRNFSSEEFARHLIGLWSHRSISAAPKWELKSNFAADKGRNNTLFERNPLTMLSAPKGIFYRTQRLFHAAGSKVQYLDFRHRFRTNHLKLHLLIIRRQKMKKHKRRKFRRKFKCLLAKQRLKREIAKEKAFRVELLTMIRRSESFDPKEYALRKIAEINEKPKELTKEESLEELKELIRKNRYQVDYIKPKHKRDESAQSWLQ